MISQAVAELWRFINFQKGDHQPCWSSKNSKFCRPI